MNLKHYPGLLLIPLLFFIVGCKKKDEGDKIVAQSISHYFPSGLDHTSISFDFRDKAYSAVRYPDKFIYTRSFEDSTGFIKDILVNSLNFTRTMNGDTIQVSEEWGKKYSASINSVLYFFQLPYVLNDPAARKTLMDEVNINNKDYYSIKVTFAKQQGGEDHDDQYIYWVDKEDFTIDYFAYSYTVDGGGVRFREAINQRRVDGLLFQDYINYEVAIKTPLEAIPQLFMENKLKVLSEIINKNIEVDSID